MPERKTLSVADYSVFFGMLTISSLIGVFFAWRDRKHQSTQMFLLGGRRLHVIPVSMSLLASYYSSNTVLGLPADVYSNGTQYFALMFVLPIILIISAEVFLPVFYHLQITSVNSYLRKRFDSELVRLAGSLSILLSAIPYLGIVLYGPSLALGAVTNLSVNNSVLLIGLVCTFYTAIGGIKAVIWTDVVQLILMCGGMLLLVIQGTSLAGGIEHVWKISDQGGRIKLFDIDPSLYSAYTLWNVIFGAGVRLLAAYSVDQMQIQRTCAMPTLKKAKLILYLLIPGIFLISLLAGLTGLIMFTYYKTCDPLKGGLIDKSDQILPYFVMETMSQTPGLAGLFVACVFSSSLSTLSSGLNSLAAISWEDFFKRCFKKDTRYSVWITKLLAVFYGGFIVGIAFAISRLRSIFQASIALSGSQLGPKIGLYLMGMLLPFCNKQGALMGMFAGEALCVWLIFATLAYPRPALTLPVSTIGCSAPNSTFGGVDLLPEYFDEMKPTVPPYHPTGILQFYHMSPMLMALFGFIVTLIVGIAASLLTGGWSNCNVDPNLVSPVVRKLWKDKLRPKEDVKDPSELQTLTNEKEANDCSNQDEVMASKKVEEASC